MSSDNPGAAALPQPGSVSRPRLETCPGYEPARAAAYTPDPQALARIRSKAAGVQVLLFSATWCPDCHREVPRFFRIVDATGIGEAQVSIILVDRARRDPDGLAAQHQIRAVPTFVFLADGRELGRIVERPYGTLEAHIAQVLAGR